MRTEILCLRGYSQIISVMTNLQYLLFVEHKIKMWPDNTLKQHSCILKGVNFCVTVNKSN